MKNKAIGIIGGMGPEASGRFYNLLIRLAQKEYHVEKNEDFPEAYLASIPVPDFISTQKNKEKALKMIIKHIEAMDQLPIGFYCMACNTGHLLLPVLQKHTKYKFISLLTELPLAIKAKGISKVGLLATPTTIRTKMYQQQLESNNIKLIIPEKREVDVLGKIIIETIAGKNKKRNSILIEKIALNLVKRGAKGIIEGCTEIPLIAPKRYLVPKFDTLEILARAVLKKYYLLK